MRKPYLIAALVLLAPTMAWGAPDESAPTLDNELRAIAALKARGEIDDALVLANRLREGHPDLLEAQVAYQDLRIARGETRKMLPVYSRRATRPEATADDIYLHARLLEGRRAVKAYKEALGRDPNHFWTLCALGTIYSEAGRIQLAKESLEKAREVKPASAIPVNGLGWLAEKTGDATTAAEMYHAAIEKDASFLLPRINLGFLLLRERKLIQADRVLAEAAKLAPADPMPILGQGMVRAAFRDLKGAVELYEKSVALNSNTPATLNFLGTAYMGLGQYDLARKSFDRALEIQPQDLSTVLNLGYLCLLEDKKDLAQAWMQRAIKIDPKSPEANYFLGLCREYAGKSGEALKCYKRAASLDKESSNYPRAMGSLYSKQGRWKEAIRAHRKAVDNSDRAPGNLLDLAFAYVGAGEYRSAVICFEEVAEKEPDNLTAWMNIGLLYQEKLRKKTQAIDAYEEYLRQGGTDPRVKTWLTDLLK